MHVFSLEQHCTRMADIQEIDMTYEIDNQYYETYLDKGETAA